MLKSVYVHVSAHVIWSLCVCVCTCVFDNVCLRMSSGTYMAVQRVVADVGGPPLKPLHVNWPLGDVKVESVVVRLPLLCVCVCVCECMCGVVWVWVR